MGARRRSCAQVCIRVGRQMERRPGRRECIGNDRKAGWLPRRVCQEQGPCKRKSAADDGAAFCDRDGGGDADRRRGRHNQLAPRRQRRRRNDDATRRRRARWRRARWRRARWRCARRHRGWWRRGGDCGGGRCAPCLAHRCTLGPVRTAARKCRGASASRGGPRAQPLRRRLPPPPAGTPSRLLHTYRRTRPAGPPTCRSHRSRASV